jgi:glyceraldehyde 3-phosphate dehydrogenase
MSTPPSGSAAPHAHRTNGAEGTADDTGLSWSVKLSLAEAMIPLIGRLHRDLGVQTTVHGRDLVDKSVIDIIKAHRFARRIDETELPLTTSLQLLGLLNTLQPSPMRVDLARLAAQVAGDPTQEAVRAVLHTVPGAVTSTSTSTATDALSGNDSSAGGRGPQHLHGERQHATADVVLYGFGRIGRLLARILLQRSSAHGLQLRAIVVRPSAGDSDAARVKDLVKRASLLRRDSVHGAFAGTITIDRERRRIIANGTPIQVIYSDHPATIDYTRYGIHEALLIDNTGKWRDEAGLAQHLNSPGIARVLLTAPGKGGVKNIVHGLNEDTISPADRLISAASCTTNAISPVLKVLNDAYGIEHGHVETVHSFTNDQNLIDNFHPADRRGRSAALNMVLTETGAARAVAKALPELAGKLTGSSIRVPTPDVSLAILNLILRQAVTKTQVNEHLRAASLHSALQQQIDYVESPEVVSSDFVGSPGTGVVDALATIAGDGAAGASAGGEDAPGPYAVVYVWYDNEYGYSHQVLRVAESMTGTALPTVPPAPPASSHQSPR